MNNYVVYVHKDINGYVRYVGSGSISRANITSANSNRGIKYKLYVETNGKLTPEIIYDSKTKEESIDLEKLVFYRYYGDNLLNINIPSKVKDLPSQEYLRNFLYYDESSPSCLRWGANRGRVKVGMVAGSIDSKGYYCVRINGDVYLAHRLVLSLLNNSKLQQRDIIDHIDGNKRNNSINNLRVVTQAINARNKSISSRNKSGYTGICKEHSRGYRVWRAYIFDPIKLKSKSASFSCKKYTDDVAKSLAISWRETKLQELDNLYGLGYSTKHGV